MPLKAEQQDMPVHFFADGLRRTGIAHVQVVQQQQRPKQLVDEQTRDAIALGYPRDLPVHPQTQKRLRGNVDAGYSVYIGPSHEFHGGQFLLYLGCCGTSTIIGEEHNYKELLSEPTLSRCKKRKNLLPSAEYSAGRLHAIQGRDTDGISPCRTFGSLGVACFYHQRLRPDEHD